MRRVIILNNTNKKYTKRVRLSEAECKTIMKKAKAQNRTFSSYIRYLAECEVPIDTELRKQLIKLTNEVNYIGHNINQIVKNNNSGLYSEIDKSRLMKYMRILNEKVENLIVQNGNK